MSRQPPRHPIASAGFTIVELMVALALTFVACGGIYMSYVTYSSAGDAQEEMLAMQQNGRIALSRLAKDLRMAGFDPTGDADAGITLAGSSQITFTMDLNEDGDLADTGEDLTYSVVGGELDRNDNTVVGETRSLVDGVDAIDFVYLDQDGAVTADLNEIRTVRVSILVRTINPDATVNDTTTYLNSSGTGFYTAAGDQFRRRVVATEVACRNLDVD
ncbi:MAG: PilW family protein [Thermodesulfobacteriota bacterium]